MTEESNYVIAIFIALFPALLIGRVIFLWLFDSHLKSVSNNVKDKY